MNHIIKLLIIGTKLIGSLPPLSILPFQSFHFCNLLSPLFLPSPSSSDSLSSESVPVYCILFCSFFFLRSRSS